MRLFFALWPPPDLQTRLADLAAACRVECGGRSVPLSNLHATLAFLGEVDSSRLAELGRIATRVGESGFDLMLDRIGHFRRSRIVYAGASFVAPALVRLATALAGELARNGFRAEDRPYVPHVTLLRDARRAPESVRCDALLWQVRHIVLAESVRGRSGPVYRPLHRFMLAS